MRMRRIVICGLPGYTVFFLTLSINSTIFEKKKLFNTNRVSLFHGAFFNAIIDKHQHMHFTFNNILV